LTGFAAALLAITMIAAFVLVIGGVQMIVRQRQPKKGALMLVAALVLVGNVLIWTV
jgi:predicted MFS family arabinose efflux permease